MNVALKIICSVAFLVVAFHQVSPRELLHLLLYGHGGAGWSLFSPLVWWIWAAAAIGLLCALVNTLKWWMLLRGAGIRMAWRRVFYHYLVGYFLNTILTGTGEVKRVVDVGRETGNTSAVLTSVFIERWTGVSAQLTLSLAALIVASSIYSGLAWLVAFNAAACFMLFALYVALVVASRRSAAPQAPVSGRLQRMWATALVAFAETRKARGVMLGAAVLSVIVPLLGVVFHACLGLALGTTLGFVWVVPIASVFGQMPVSINGLGVQEVAYLKLFQITGLTVEEAMGVSMLAHGVKLSVGALGGLLSLWAAEAQQEPVAVQS